MMNVIVRSYRPDKDWSGWKEVNKQSGHLNPYIDQEEVFQDLSHEKGRIAMMVAEISGQIVGIAAVEIVGLWAHIWRLGVLPEWGDRGIGTQLLLEVEKFIISRGCKQWQLFARPDRVEWYKKYGFEQEERLILLRKESGGGNAKANS